MAHKGIKNLVTELCEFIESKNLSNTFSVAMSVTGNAIHVRNSCCLWDNAELIFEWASRYKSGTFIASFQDPQHYIRITIIPYENEQ